MTTHTFHFAYSSMQHYRVHHSTLGRCFVMVVNLICLVCYWQCQKVGTLSDLTFLCSFYHWISHFCSDSTVHIKESLQCSLPVCLCPIHFSPQQSKRACKSFRKIFKKLLTIEVELIWPQINHPSTWSLEVWWPRSLSKVDLWSK